MIQRELTVKTAEPYKIIIGRDILAQCGDMIKNVCEPSKACMVIDENAEKYYGGEVGTALKNAGFTVYSFTLKSGEQSKSIAVAEQLYNFLIKNSFTRSDILVAVGGGVTGDLTGFVAATFLRGVSFVQIPTTFLAAVDSSVGGKTAVNIPAGKNLVGAFWQPRLVVCDVKTFDTLSDEIYADGIAEAVKYGAILDKNLFELMKNHDIKENATDIVYRCIDLKREIVEADEFENGVRKKLNFGHTIGHAIEKYSNFKISHGKAVAIGMVIVTKAAQAAGITKQGTLEQLLEILEKYNLPTNISADLNELCAIAGSDKKRSGGSITLILLKDIGESVLYKIKIDEMANFIAHAH